MAGKGHVLNYEKAIDRIRKLLALAKSPNESEAAVAATKAAEMLLEYNLTEADIGEKPEPSKVQEKVYCVMRKLPAWRFRLGRAVAGTCTCDAILARDSKNKAEGILFVGREHNIAASEVLYDYLSQAVLRLSRGLRDRRLSREKYRDGVVHGLEVRLRQHNLSRQISNALVILEHEVQHHKMLMDLNDARVPALPTDTASFWKGTKDARTIGLDKQVAGPSRTKELSPSGVKV